MRSRTPPSSLVLLALLIFLSIVAAIAAGGTLYVQTKHAAQTQAAAITGGDCREGRRAIARYACGEIAGTLPNDPGAMVGWLMHPQRIAPGSGMPEQGVTERDARDIAAYLYAQR
jgi:cytochrome c